MSPDGKNSLQWNMCCAAVFGWDVYVRDDKVGQVCRSDCTNSMVSAAVCRSRASRLVFRCLTRQWLDELKVAERVLFSSGERL